MNENFLASFPFLASLPILQFACASNPCGNDGFCRDSFNSLSNNQIYQPQYSCICPEGFTGTNCQLPTSKLFKVFIITPAFIQQYLKYYCIVLVCLFYCFILYYIVVYFIVICIVLHCIALYGIVLYRLCVDTEML